MTEETKEEREARLVENKKRLMEILRSNKHALYMGQVPPTTKKAFIKWSSENFFSNYGFALHELWTSYWTQDAKYNDLNNKIDAAHAQLQSQIDILGDKPPEKNEKEKILDRIAERKKRFESKKEVKV